MCERGLSFVEIAVHFEKSGEKKRSESGSFRKSCVKSDAATVNGWRVFCASLTISFRLLCVCSLSVSLSSHKPENNSKKLLNLHW